MAKIITAMIPEDAKELEKVNATDITLIAFSYNKETVDYSWVLEADDNYLIRTSFLLADKEPEKSYDMAYLNHPAFALLNLNNMDDIRSDLARKVVSVFNATNSYYSDFTPVSIVDNTAIINIIHKDMNDATKYKKVLLPFHIYMKIASIKYFICSKFLFNPSLSEESSYEKYKLIEKCKLSYLGTEPTEDLYMFHNFYSLSYENKKIGIACPYHASSLISMIDKIYKESSFTLFYPNNMVVDPTVMIPIFWKNDLGAGVELKIAILRRRTKEVFIINQEEYMMIMNPINLIHGGIKNE